ncbi:MAG TPA: efflux transporter outer membrane subunit [Casimicrobiaceae bacterium]|nr:efflux transporter outer membrane subunit [Casimicrobiaceae bacterium]
MRPTHSYIATAVLAIAALAGCTTTPTAPPRLELPAASTADPGVLASQRWWTAFGDPTLDKLVDEALAHNLDIADAITRVDFARAQVLFAQADLYPTVDLAAGATRSRISQVGSTPLPAGFPPITNDYRVGLQASYELDLWGKYRTATGAARQDLLASEYARETVRTSVEAGTAQAYFTLVAADVQLALLNDTLKSRDDALALQRDLMQAGVIGEYEFHAAEAERAAVVGDIAVAKRAVAEAESALAALAGRSPREVFDPKVDRDQRYERFTTVPVIPAGLASDLLERRPDIRQSEAQLAAANMRIDVARADYFPAISLTGLFGSEAAVLRSLFTGPAAIWSIGASLAQPIVGLKAIEANVDAQTARRNQAVVGYTRTVQLAFKDAHDALSANTTTREALAAETQRAHSLQQTLELSDTRYKAGYSPYLEVLDAQRQLLQAQTLQIVAARNARFALIDLARALGGGWDAGAVDAVVARP